LDKFFYSFRKWHQKKKFSKEIVEIDRRKKEEKSRLFPKKEIKKLAHRKKKLPKKEIIFKKKLTLLSW